MARLLSKTLIPHGRSFLLRSIKLPPAPQTGICFRCHFSSKAQLIEIDLDASSASSSSSSSASPSSQSERGAEFDAAVVKKLDDMVRRIIVHKATPDWLPFVPGASFWVPTPRNTAAKIADLVEKASNQLTEEESLSVMTLRGWPCSSFFIPPDDSASAQELEVDLEFKIPGNEVLEVKLELLPDSEDSAKPGDEEK